jgi:hypothetical protein
VFDNPGTSLFSAFFGQYFSLLTVTCP